MTHVTVATAGHIDHGKSTLVEALTGTHPDRLKEERSRGISIELGFAHTQIGDTTVAFVDVPGHERFVRHMLAGVGGIDALLCVVAADESVMPQTREHVAIASLLGVTRAVVAVTKADIAGEFVDLVAVEADDLLRSHGIEVSAVVPVSARTGAGLDALRDALAAVARRNSVRELDVPARLPVDRAFSVRGFGTVVTGTLWAGRLHVDQEIVVQPGGQRYRIRGLQVHGRAAAVAEAGQRAAVNLAQALVEDVERGVVLTGEGGLLVTRRVDARVRVLAGGPALRHGTRVHLHVGTAMVLARIALLGDGRGEPAGDSRGDGVAAIPSGETGLARVRLESPVPLRRGDRFVLRSYSPVTTIAGGVVVDPDPPRRLSRRAAAARLAALGGIGPANDAMSDLLCRLAAEAGVVGLPLADVPPRLGTSPAAVAALAGAASGSLVSLGDRLVDSGALAALRAQILEDVDAHHAADPTSDGLPRESLRQRRGRRAHRAVVEQVVSSLIADGVLSVADDRLARPAHRAARAAEEDARAAVVAYADAAGLQAATHDDLLGQSGLPAAEAEALIRRLVRDDALTRLGALYVSRAALAALVADLRRRQAAEGLDRLDVGWFKERYGLTRRTAIPLLEWLDRQRVTRRVGDARVLLAP